MTTTDIIPSQSEITLTETGASFTDSITFEGWADAGKRLGGAAASFQLAVGDWLIYGEDRWRGQEAFDFGAELAKSGRVGSDFLDYACMLTGLDRGVLKKYAHVARHVDAGNRRPGLSFKHYEVLAKIREEEQEKWISLIEDAGDRVSSRQLAKSIELNDPQEAPRLWKKEEIVEAATKERPAHIDAPEAALARFIRSMEAQDFSDWTPEMKEFLRKRFDRARELMEAI